ncbi:MAG: GNAT family N-acetyltransferase [Alphaproteobacteria bacterium]|nr:GNAT family N-acetyltransferase [Alphaproteobacteria bacterium]
MGVITRPIRPNDADTVAALAAALSAHEGEPPPPFDAEIVRRWAFGADPRFSGVIAERNGVAVGYALWHDGFHVGRGTPGLFLMDLFVVPSARRRGVGGTLMEAVTEAAREREGTWVVWQVHPDNREAMAFYRRVGGRRYGAADFEMLIEDPDDGGFR